ncbi:MAG: leucyl/phenylalanyl-tRNA--protein transferase [Verrucomicrobiales bacterium]
MIPETQRIDPNFLVNAYASGVFPMALEDGEIGWFSPDPRGIIPLEGFRPPHGMKRVLEEQPFEIRVDTVFEEVMRGCADREETWINESIIETYVELYERGHAHSVEAWEGDELVGGLYGVSLGSAFFGESMFSKKSEASKLCLVHLIERMRERGFTLLDTQWTNPHLEKFGAIDISKAEYSERLNQALAGEARFTD